MNKIVLESLISRLLLSEAKDNAEFLVKLNFDSIKKSNPEMHPKDISLTSKKGPIYDERIISSLNDLKIEGGIPRPIQMWLGNLMKNGERCPSVTKLSKIITWANKAKLDPEDMADFVSVEDAHRAAIGWDSVGHVGKEVVPEDTSTREIVAKLDSVYTIQILDPNSALYVGNKLGHCYKANGAMTAHYQRGIKDGSIILYCLYKNKHPKVTFDYQVKENTIHQIKGIHDKPPEIREYIQKCKEWLETTNFKYHNCPDYEQMVFNFLSDEEKSDFAFKALCENYSSFDERMFRLLNEEKKYEFIEIINEGKRNIYFYTGAISTPWVFERMNPKLRFKVFKESGWNMSHILDKIYELLNEEEKEHYVSVALLTHNKDKNVIKYAKPEYLLRLIENWINDDLIDNVIKTFCSDFEISKQQQQTIINELLNRCEIVDSEKEVIDSIIYVLLRNGGEAAASSVNDFLEKTNVGRTDYADLLDDTHIAEDKIQISDTCTNILFKLIKINDELLSFTPLINEIKQDAKMSSEEIFQILTNTIPNFKNEIIVRIKHKIGESK